MNGTEPGLWCHGCYNGNGASTERAFEMRVGVDVQQPAQIWVLPRYRLPRGYCAGQADALELTQDFELASYTRQGGIWDRQMLEEGPRPMQYS